MGGERREGMKASFASAFEYAYSTSMLPYFGLSDKEYQAPTAY